MSDTSSASRDHPVVDPGRREPNEQFDQGDGYSGQDYDREREAAEGADRPSGHPLIGDPATSNSPQDADRRDIPPENGRRASFDPATGEVHGSGSGTGEDFDAGTSGGPIDATAPGATSR